MSWNLEADHLIKMIWAICKSSLHHWSIITAAPIQTEAAPQKKTMKHLKDSHTVRSKVLWPDGTKAELLTLILNLFGGNHPQHSGAQPGPKILHQEDDHKNTRKVCAQNLLTSLLHNRNKWETFPWVTTDPETRWAEMTVHSKLGLLSLHWTSTCVMSVLHNIFLLVMSFLSFLLYICGIRVSELIM